MDNHFAYPSVHTISDTNQNAIDLLGHQGTLLAHVQMAVMAVDRHPQVLLCWGTFWPLPQAYTTAWGCYMTQVQLLSFSLVECHAIGHSPAIQPIRNPLQSRPTLKQLKTPTQLSVVCKPTDGALSLIINIID